MSEFAGIPYSLLLGNTGEGYLWVKTLRPAGQLLLLCPEDPLLQSLVEGPQELASCKHTVTNGLDKEEGKTLTFEDAKINSIESKFLINLGYQWLF